MVKHLIEMGVPPTQAKLFAEPVAAAMALFDITRDDEKAAFMAQCAIESANFTRLEENLYYTTPERIRAVWPTRVPNLATASLLTRSPERLANVVYANRNGNGDTQSGDGWKYRGRGLFQLTGKANYQAASAGLGMNLIDNPALVAEPSGAALTAAWYWHNNNCGALFAKGGIDAVTKAINGPAMLHAKERREMYARAMDAYDEFG